MKANLESKAALKKPVQKRSRETLDRIYAATEELLKQKRFSKISIAEIASEAECGVGTVYGRFENKRALLDSLEICVVQNLVDRMDEFIGSRDWSGLDFENRVKLLIDHIAEGYRVHGPVLRELIGRVHQSADGPTEDSRVKMSFLFARNVDFLLESLGQGETKLVRKMIGLAIMSVIVTLQNRMLQFETSPIKQEFSGAYLKTELPKMVIAYVRSSSNW